MKQNWDLDASWYASCVGEKGHYYHQAVILPNVLRMLGTVHSLLDIGCGNGVLARHLPKDVEYLGIDQSQKLINEATKQSKGRLFYVADATELSIEKHDFDRAIFLLSLQNIEDGEKALFHTSQHVKKNGRLLLILNHPCFRIPRQSSWGVDVEKKLQYRRLNGYLSPQKIPIQTHPSKSEQSSTTYTYHHPLSDYAQWLQKAHCSIVAMEEWCSDKVSVGKMARMENRARHEFPLFLAIEAVKLK